MSTHPNRATAQHGLTLIELVIFIVIISVAVSGVLITLTTVVKSSADPLVSRQLQSIAEAMLEEVLMQDFVDPDSSGLEGSRAEFDNVDDYNGFDSASAGITFPNGDPVAGLDDYRVQVVVSTSAAWGTTHPVPVGSAKLVTVTASRLEQSFSLSGYRS
jgi:MSHA pilin protein MshD